MEADDGGADPGGPGAEGAWAPAAREMRRVRPEHRRGAWEPQGAVSGAGRPGASTRAAGARAASRGRSGPHRAESPAMRGLATRGAHAAPRSRHGPFHAAGPGLPPARHSGSAFDVADFTHKARRSGGWSRGRCPRAGPPGTSKAGLTAAGPRAACPFTASGRWGPAHLASPVSLVRPSPGAEQGLGTPCFASALTPSAHYGPSKLFLKFFQTTPSRRWARALPSPLPAPIAGPGLRTAGDP